MNDARWIVASSFNKARGAASSSESVTRNWRKDWRWALGVNSLDADSLLQRQTFDIFDLVSSVSDRWAPRKLIISSCIILREERGDYVRCASIRG